MECMPHIYTEMEILEMEMDIDLDMEILQGTGDQEPLASLASSLSRSV